MGLPCARTDGLIVETLPGETLIYDEHRDQVHCLSSVAAAILALCDGTHDTEQIAALASERLGASVTAYDVEEALDQLGGCHLLEGARIRPRELSRRQMIRGSLVAGSIGAAIPLITTIVAPVPAAAATGGTTTTTTTTIPNGGACTSTSQCVTGSQCLQGVCCVPAGGACTTNSDCCAGSSLSCNGGTCNVP